MFQCQRKFLWREVRPFQNSKLERFIDFLGLADGHHDVFVDILQKREDERCSNVLNPVFKPHIVVQEVPLPRQNAQMHREGIVVAIHDRNQGIPDFLGDVQNAGKVHNAVFVAAELADRADDHRLAVLPENLQNWDRVLVDSQKIRHHRRVREQLFDQIDRRTLEEGLRLGGREGDVREGED